MNNSEFFVNGENLLNIISTELLEIVLPQLNKYLHTKIQLSDNSKSKKFVVEIPNKLHNVTNLGFISFSDSFSNQSRMYLKVKFSLQFTKDTVRYFEDDICIAKLNNGILTEIYDFDYLLEAYKLTERYTNQEVKEAQQRIKDLDNELSNLKSKYNKFNRF